MRYFLMAVALVPIAQAAASTISDRPPELMHMPTNAFVLTVSGSIGAPLAYRANPLGERVVEMPAPDTANLSFARIAADSAAIEPSLGFIATGPASFEPEDAYTGFTRPPTFGSGGQTSASSGSGDITTLSAPITNLDLLGVPRGYVSGSALSGSSTYDNQTFSSLGVTPGTYVWTWSSGSFTLDIPGAAVPEPSSLGLLALPLGFVTLLAARHRLT